MLITKEQLLDAVNQYIDTDIMSHTSKMSAFEQFVFGFKIGVFKRSLPDKLNTYLESPSIKLLGIVSDDGKLNLDIIYASAVDSIKRVGSIEISELRFNESDLNKLYTIIKERSG